MSGDGDGTLNEETCPVYVTSWQKHLVSVE